jgi:pyochelin biosynthesis protein PchC
MIVSIAGQDRWVRILNPCPDSHTRLFCFPYAGGPASYYYWLSAALAPTVEVRALQYPGRLDRRAEPSLRNIPDLADFACDALRSSLGKPYAFFGHSMGAVVAYEVARRLTRKTGTGPGWLFVSGRRAPTRQRPATMYLRSDAGLVKELRTRGEAVSPWLDDPEARAAILPSVRRDYQAIETYHHTPGPELDCPITVLTGDSDPDTTREEASAWQGHSSGSFDLRMFSGGHFFIDTHRQEVARIVMTALGPPAESRVLDRGMK